MLESGPLRVVMSAVIRTVMSGDDDSGDNDGDDQRGKDDDGDDERGKDDDGDDQRGKDDDGDGDVVMMMYTRKFILKPFFGLWSGR